MKFHKRFELGGRTAIVTGALGILGRHFCEGLAEFGANVAVVDLGKTACEEFADTLRAKFGIHAIGVGCDITNPDQVSLLVEKVTAELGDIHVLHNNVGGKSSDLDLYFAPVERYSADEWRRSIEVNLDGVFLVDQAVGARMVRQRKGGSIIHMGSIYGAMAPDQRIYRGSEYLGHAINTPPVYAAAKAGVIGLTRYLATYWAEHGIRVNCISPGGAESGQNDEFKRRYSARVPLGRMAQPEELVPVLIWLASDASSYVTGQNIMVDGGLSAW